MFRIKTDTREFIIRGDAREEEYFDSCCALILGLQPKVTAEKVAQALEAGLKKELEATEDWHIPAENSKISTEPSAPELAEETQPEDTPSREGKMEDEVLPPP